MVVFGKKVLYSGKNACSLAKVVIFLQSGCIRAKWLHSQNVV